MFQQLCHRCGYQWTCRVKAPKKCPKCWAPLRKAEPAPAQPSPPDALEPAVLAALKAGAGTLLAISDQTDRSVSSVRRAIEQLRQRGHNIHLHAEAVNLSPEVAPAAQEPLIIHNLAAYNNQWRKFGATGDNHLGSKHERLDVLGALYDLYAQEGIEEVYNTGNWIEGNCRLNYHDVKVFGLDDQVAYLLEHYPQRQGITTYFVAGDDHEGWFQRQQRVEIGKYVEFAARAAGRTDLIYLGYLEANVELKAKTGSCWMRVMHPGGGSAYAHSYAPQKLVESFQGGEKPSILLLGHYHKFDYCYPREVHVIQTGCTVDQSIFMRKSKIQAMVGGCIVWLNQAPDGTINRLRVEWMPFYDRGFYGDRSRRFGLGNPKQKAA